MLAPTRKRHNLKVGRKFSNAPEKKPTADPRLADADSFLLPTYKRQPFVISHGRGAYVFDGSGKKYLDFLGGIAVNALGHAHPRVVKVVRREVARALPLLETAGHLNPDSVQTRLALATCYPALQRLQEGAQEIAMLERMAPGLPQVAELKATLARLRKQ